MNRTTTDEAAERVGIYWARFSLVTPDPHLKKTAEQSFFRLTPLRRPVQCVAAAILAVLLISEI